jgi:hypothetical protein
MSPTPQLQWIPLVSSHIEAMAHVPQTGELFVRFKNGNIYRYPDAHPDEVESLRNADSPGRALNLLFRGRGAKVE